MSRDNHVSTSFENLNDVALLTPLDATLNLNYEMTRNGEDSCPVNSYGYCQ